MNSSFLTGAEVQAIGFASVGHSVMIHPSVVIVGAEYIDIGNYVRIDPFTVITAGSGRLVVGNYVHIATSVLLLAGAGIELGDFATVSHGAKLFSRSDDFSGTAMTGPMVPRDRVLPTEAPVTVGRHCVIGAGSVVMPGVGIGEGSVTGALAFVNTPLESWGVYVGAPTRRIRDRHKRALELGRELEDLT